MNTVQSETPSLQWFKSSYSGGEGGDCVEVAPAPWFKSSYSSGEGGECVEIASTPAIIHIRDSKIPTHGTLAVRPEAWSAFLALACQG